MEETDSLLNENRRDDDKEWIGPDGKVHYGDWNEEDGKKKRKQGWGSLDWWSHTFWIDWAVVVVLFALFVTFYYNVPKQDTLIQVADLSISSDLKSDRVPGTLLGLIIGVSGACIGLFVFFVRRDGGEDFHSYVLAVVLPIAMAYACYAVFNPTIAKLRPDFIMRCAPACMENFSWTCAPDRSLYDAQCTSDQPCCPIQCGRSDPRYSGGIVPCSFVQNGVNMSGKSVQDTCSSIWHVPVNLDQLECAGYMGSPVIPSYNTYSISEGYRALPSAHSMFAFNFATTAWLYLTGKCRVYNDALTRENINRRGGEHPLYSFGVLLAVIFWVFAIFVAFTRVNDNKHSILDVSAGAILGISTSYLCYYIYYDDPRSSNGGDPIRRKKLKCERLQCCCPTNDDEQKTTYKHQSLSKATL